MKVKVKWLISTLRDPMDCSLPGSSVHGIFQARVLEWGAIAFSERFHIAGEIGCLGVCFKIFRKKKKKRKRGGKERGPRMIKNGKVLITVGAGS